MNKQYCFTIDEVLRVKRRKIMKKVFPWMVIGLFVSSVLPALLPG